MRERSVTYNDIKVVYFDPIDGGGRGFGQQYVPVIKEKIGSVEHVFEFCAGPGFIGFSLLAQGLCKKLTLADINQSAVEVCKETVRRNGLGDKVSVYLSDELQTIPSTEQWDLVVGNPPHYSCADDATYHTHIRNYDPQWRIHKGFYRAISKFLKPGGSVMLQENRDGSSVEDFRQMIEEGGLTVRDVFSVPVKNGAKRSSFVKLFPRLDLSLLYKIFNPAKVHKHMRWYLASRKRMQTATTSRFYFIWCVRDDGAGMGK